ncbi:hypothetical protein NBRC116583_36060 [Arenicella sp. 4NH20-0111]|uniref:di-heme-cytochrome C peroxidase n=1 Tax=Arenicella sp. 4NH20-0111 TaxID=3127648 RepID=UPI00310A52E0
MLNGTRFLFVGAMLCLTGCFSAADHQPVVDSIDVVPVVGEAPERIKVEQGWDDKTRGKFWFTSQGSRIIPYSWFTWLEQADSSELFRSVQHMEMLRYLPVDSSAKNPSGLPIGFVAAHDKKTNEPWVGMTCAACHTNQIDYQGKKLLIDGAPTLANFVLFYSRLVDALNETNMNDAKFNRFAKNVLGDGYTKVAAENLRETLTSVTVAAAQRQEVNSLPESFPKDFTSYARLDAFGNIQNAGTAFALHDLANRNTPSGPVSYPFLWGTHQSDVVQWNASAPNVPRIIGPLARNVGEVVGVFGDLSIDKAPWWKRLLGLKVSYSSNVDIEGLGRLEAMVKTLRSPEWPASHFPPIDAIKAAQGAELFASDCASCHQVIAREDEGKNYKANRTPVDEIGTDPVTAKNADLRCAESLILEGTKKAILIGDRFAAETSAISIPVNGAVGVILNHPRESLEAGLRPIRAKSSSTKSAGDVATESSSSPEDEEAALDRDADNHPRSIKEEVTQHLEARLAISSGKDSSSAEKTTATCGDPDAELVYKGRPLNGIWATAPYLHNGSVPNLWELMQEGDKRVDSFWVGSRNFDPVNVGFDTTQGLNEFQVKDSENRIQPGNSNRGHEFGTQWSDDQKWAVIEYMKTL